MSRVECSKPRCFLPGQQGIELPGQRWVSNTKTKQAAERMNNKISRKSRWWIFVCIEILICFPYILNWKCSTKVFKKQLKRFIFQVYVSCQNFYCVRKQTEKNRPKNLVFYWSMIIFSIHFSSWDFAKKCAILFSFSSLFAFWLCIVFGTY